MTEEVKNAIFQEYFRPAKVISTDIYCGDLSITNVGLNSEIGYNTNCLRRSGLQMEVLADYFYYGDIEVMEGCLEDKDEINDAADDRYGPERRLIQGESKQWQLVSFIISDDGDNGDHFINLFALRKDLDGYLASAQQGFDKMDKWMEDNSCHMMYFDGNRTTLISIEDSKAIYLVRSAEEDEYVSPCIVTVNGVGPNLWLEPFS